MSVSVTAIVLAAGLGTRMRSPLAKVLHPLLGRPMVGWVVEALRPHRTVLVVHHQAELVAEAVPGCVIARQETPRGTGDAVRAALGEVPHEGLVIVAAGDTPLVTSAVVQRLLEEHRGRCTVASFTAANPHGYGRIVREGGTRIVEEAHATEGERRIAEVNSGLYVFDAAYLHDAIPRLDPHPPKGEFYLTDLIQGDAHVVGGFDEALFLGVNDRLALATARALLRQRVNEDHARSGVDFADLTVSIDVTATLHPGASVGMGAVIEGASEVHGTVGHHVVIRDTFVGPGAVVHPHSVCDGARVGADCVVGPFARLRPGSVLESRAHVGNFVEMKAARLGEGAKANHLAYLGDADIGAAANIGAGTITCNYDGFRKNRTVIGARAFIGSNTSLVAPISIGEDAIIGAGSTITADVPSNALAVERSPTKVSEGSANRLRARLKARP